MCEENNNLECSCLKDLFKTIIKLQKQDFKCCSSGGCDRPFLGPSPSLSCYNTRPINLYNCQTGELWSISYTLPDGTTSVSDVFRCESIDDCCLTCRILIDNLDGTYTSTNQFFTINLNCVSAVRCRPDVFIALV